MRRPTHPIVALALTASPLLVLAPSALAQGNCAATLTYNDIRALLGVSPPATVCACSPAGASALLWNETHITGTIREFGNGSISPATGGPQIGSFTVNNIGAGAGTVTYIYGSLSHTFVIDNAPVGSVYRFCAFGNIGTNYLIKLKPGVCTAVC